MARSTRINLWIIQSSMDEVDKATGEVKAKKYASWLKLDIEGCESLAIKSLSKNEYRVMFMLFSRLSFNNRLFVNKTTLAREFGCSRVMISNTMAMLEKKEIIEKIGRAYKVNNSYVRCG